jgi:hypothetical protein
LGNLWYEQLKWSDSDEQQPGIKTKCSLVFGSEGNYLLEQKVDLSEFASKKEMGENPCQWLFGTPLSATR